MKKIGSIGFKVILVLLVASLALTSCSLRMRSSVYEKGDLDIALFDGSTGRNIFIAAKSNTRSFDIDGVTLELYYGFHEQGDVMAKGNYIGSDFEDMIFAFYAVEGYSWSSYSFRGAGDFYDGEDACFNDHKNIESHTYLKELSKDEAFSGEYSYDIKSLLFFYLGGINYNHSESITVPKEIFSSDSGIFGICIAALRPKKNTDGQGIRYAIGEYAYIDFEYEKTGDGRVSLSFSQDVSRGAQGGSAEDEPPTDDDRG